MYSGVNISWRLGGLLYGGMVLFVKGSAWQCEELMLKPFCGGIWVYTVESMAVQAQWRKFMGVNGSFGNSV
jgi:hypothetical protein